jgi:hypothetical protein
MRASLIVGCIAIGLIQGTIAAASAEEPLAKPMGDGIRQVDVHVKALDVSLSELTKLGVGIEYFQHPERQGDPAKLLKDLLRGDKRVAITAEPTLSVVLGQKASYNAGGEIEMPTKRANGTAVMERIPYGTKLDLKAERDEKNGLRVDFQLDISELDESHPVTIDGKRYPLITHRSVNTKLEMKSGQTVLLGGLVQKQGTEKKDDVAGLGESQDKRSMMLVFVTAELVPLTQSASGVNTAKQDTRDHLRTGPAL